MEKKTAYLSPECEELKILIECSILSGDDGMEEGGEV